VGLSSYSQSGAGGDPPQGNSTPQSATSSSPVFEVEWLQEAISELENMQVHHLGRYHPARIYYEAIVAIELKVRTRGTFS
jgi:hypothetical protein